MISRLRSSISARAVAAIALVLAGYVLLHEHFAAFDAALAEHALGLLGFDVSSSGTSLVVSSGPDFDVYAIVTGSCSSAAGVLGLVAVSFVLLPGRVWRRSVGGLLAAGLFVAFNVLRIASIVVLGWWLATASRSVLLPTFLGLTAVAVGVAVAPHGRLLLRVGALLAGGLCAVLAYDVWRGEDYLAGMVSYHALGGPMLTFGSLALGIVVLWRTIVGPDEATRPAAV